MKKATRSLVALGIVLLLLLAGYLVQWKHISKPIYDIENEAAVQELTVRMSGVSYKNHYRIRNDSAVYQALADFLTHAVYLPCLQQDSFSLGEESRSITIRYAASSSELPQLTLTFYDDASICQVNGKNARFLSPNGSGAKAYAAIQEILRTKSDSMTLTIIEIRPGYDLLARSPSTGDAYSIPVVSEKLQTPDGTPVSPEELSVGDSITVLCDGSVLACYPYLFSSIYLIQTGS